MKKRLFPIILILSLLIFPISTHAAAYVVHLYYNTTTKALSLDKMASQSVSLDNNIHPDYLAFAQDQTQGEYIIKLYDINNNEIISTEFNKQKEAFTLEIPYFSLANNLKIFEKSSNKELLQADLSQYLTCNGNGICELEKGETAQNCIGDCATINNNYSPETLEKLKQNNGIVTQDGVVILRDYHMAPIDQQNQSKPEESKGSNYILLILASLGLAVSAYIIYRRVAKK